MNEETKIADLQPAPKPALPAEDCQDPNAWLEWASLFA